MRTALTSHFDESAEASTSFVQRRKYVLRCRHTQRGKSTAVGRLQRVCGACVLCALTAKFDVCGLGWCGSVRRGGAGVCVGLC